MSIGDLFREAVSLTAVEDAIVQYSHASVSLQAFPVPNPSSEDIITGLLSPSILPLAVLTSCQLSFPSAKNITLNPGCRACDLERTERNIPPCLLTALCVPPPTSVKGRSFILREERSEYSQFWVVNYMCTHSLSETRILKKRNTVDVSCSRWRTRYWTVRQLTEKPWPVLTMIVRQLGLILCDYRKH